MTKKPSPKSVGEKSEGQILAALLKMGKVVLIPFGDNQRYDFVIDDGDEFLRIQCKTGNLKSESVVFATCSSSVHRGGGRRTYEGQIDYFGVYCPDTDKCYLVPVGDVVGRTRGASLRLSPTRNNQVRGVRWASDYEI